MVEIPKRELERGDGMPREIRAFQPLYFEFPFMDESKEYTMGEGWVGAANDEPPSLQVAYLHANALSLNRVALRA